MDEPSTQVGSASGKYQFSLQTLVGLFAIVGLLLGYLRLYGVDVIARCLAMVAVAILVGAVVGRLAQKTADAMFWGAIGAVFGFLAVLGGISYHWLLNYLWPFVGCMAGAGVAASADGHLVRRMARGALVAVVLIAPTVIAVVGWNPAISADLVCAAAGGALLGLAVELASRFERYTALPRHLLATAFVVVGIVGHWLAFHYAASFYWWLRNW